MEITYEESCLYYEIFKYADSWGSYVVHLLTVTDVSTVFIDKMLNPVESRKYEPVIPGISEKCCLRIPVKCIFPSGKQKVRYDDFGVYPVVEVVEEYANTTIQVVDGVSLVEHLMEAHSLTSEAKKGIYKTKDTDRFLEFIMKRQNTEVKQKNAIDRCIITNLFMFPITF